jgi:ribose 5-phosphate isomerase B
MFYIASDHRGFALKKYLLRYFENQLKQDIEDIGPQEYDEKDDYTDFAIKLTNEVVKDDDNKGILICGGGNGVCLAANKIKGARAILGYSIDGAQWGRRDEDANIVCLASDVLTDDHAAAIVKKFLESPFDNASRRVRRLKEIAGLEKQNL